MMTLALPLLLSLSCLLGGQSKLDGARARSEPLPPISSAEAGKLRRAFSEAVTSSDPGDWRKCLSMARKLEGKFALESLVEVVAEGPRIRRGTPRPRKVGRKKEKLRDYGRVTMGYSFEHEGRVYRYAVDMPRSYDGKDPVALLIDPGHGSGADKDARGKADFLPFFRGQVKAAGFEDWLVARTEIIEQIGAGGKRGALPEDEVAAVFGAFLRDMLTRFAIDLEQVYVTGLSQTGFWSWYLGRELADRLAGIAPMGAVTWGVDKALENLLHLPTFVIHGSEDPICPVAQPRATTRRMQELGLPVEYLEIAGGAHDGGTWSRLRGGLTWLHAQPRERVPMRVVKFAGTLANPWAHWLRLDELERESDGRAGSAPTAHAEARVEGQRIEVESSGVKVLSLWLPSELLDLEQEVSVSWNGKEVFRAVPERSFEVTMQAVLQRCDWRMLPEARIELR